MALGFLRGLIVVKRVAKPVFLAIFQPFKTVGFVLLKLIGVPLYRAVFNIRRLIDQILLPAKHRFFYLLSNRYTIHIFMIVLVGTVGFGNIQTRDVRAETFGQKSVLYSMVSGNDGETVEVVEAGKNVLIPTGSSSYFTDVPLDERHQISDLAFETSPAQTEAPTKAQIATNRTRVETYTVQDGDTLGRIAVKFHLSISTILSANGLSLRSTIRPGDTLKILPKDGVIYTVKRGDTISKIAKVYNIDPVDIANENAFVDGAALKVGSEILLPGATETASPAAIARKQVGVKDLFVDTKTQKPTKNISTNTPSVKTATGWSWPTNGHVITQYYSWKHTGIDVDADYNTYSICARDGVVSYTGWRNGYGLTVEVDHGNGLKTRYAHNSKILVNTGDVVSAGQRLAQNGSTGNSTGTHLHFEVLLNGKFQNPLSYVR